MKLPGLEDAIIARRKIVGYLLSFEHAVGRHKAAFFCRFGFSASRWGGFTAALIRHARANEVAKVDDTEFGTRYTVDGPLETPDGRRPMVRVVWFVERGESAPRLLTAFPLGWRSVR